MSWGLGRVLGGQSVSSVCLSPLQGWKKKSHGSNKRRLRPTGHRLKHTLQRRFVWMFDADDDSQEITAVGGALYYASSIRSLIVYLLGKALLGHSTAVYSQRMRRQLSSTSVSLRTNKILYSTIEPVNTKCKKNRHVDPAANLPHLSIILDQVVLGQYSQSILLHFLLPLTLCHHPARGERRHRREWHVRTVRGWHARANPGFQMRRPLQDRRLRRWRTLRGICVAERER